MGDEVGHARHGDESTVNDSVLATHRSSKLPAIFSLIAGALIAGAIIGFGAWLHAHDGTPLVIDQRWHDLAGTSLDSHVFVLAYVLHRLGSAVGVAGCVVAATILLFIIRRPRDAGALLTAALLGVVCSELLKALVARPRPLDALVFESSFSYPSGHSMGAAMLACSLALMFSGAGSRRAFRSQPTVGSGFFAARGRWDALIWSAAAIWVLGMMWSRTALRVHWLTDTIAGALLGIAVALIARTIWFGVGTRHIYTPSRPQ